MTGRLAGRSVRRFLTEYATAAGFRLGWAVVPHVPARLAFAGFDVAARLAYRRGGAGVRQLRRNYVRLRPELSGRVLERAVRDGVRSYLRYWCELFRLPSMTAAEVRNAVRVVDEHLFTAARRASRTHHRGVALFLGHMGNWDLAGRWAQLTGAQVVTVAERLEPAGVFEAFMTARRRLGMRVHPLAGGGVLTTLAGEMAEPVVVPLLADRDLTDGGITVGFPGGPVPMAAGPAALALRTGADLMPVTMHYERVPRRTCPSGFRTVLTFHPPVSAPGGRTRERARAMTQQCADAVAAEITAHTADWHMMQPFWPDDAAAPRAG